MVPSAASFSTWASERLFARAWQAISTWSLSAVPTAQKTFPCPPYSVSYVDDTAEPEGHETVPKRNIIRTKPNPKPNETNLPKNRLVMRL